MAAAPSAPSLNASSAAVSSVSQAHSVLALADELGAAQGGGVHVHPLVLFNVCDSFIRRSESSTRVIGTLLGTVSGGGSRVEVTNSYAVPHEEQAGSVSLDVDFHRTMLQLHQKVHPNEGVVGWYSTGLGVKVGDVLLHDFYARETPGAGAGGAQASAADGSGAAPATAAAVPQQSSSLPIHLTVGTGLTNGRMDVSAYVSSKLDVGESAPVGTQFTEVECMVTMDEAERIGPQLLSDAQTNKLPGEAEGLASSVSKLQSVVSTAVRYVEQVVNGETPADAATGRRLAEAVRSVPTSATLDFESAFQDNVQDVLMIEYLAKLTQTHMALADRLNKFSLPI